MAQITVKLKGKKELLAQLKTTFEGTEAGARQGLLAAGLLVQRRAQKDTPREHGILVGSAFTRPGKDNPNVVEVGYGALYARAVHEKTAEKLRGKPRPSGLGTYWNPGHSKFLERAYNESLKEIVSIIRKFARAGMKMGSQR